MKRTYLLVSLPFLALFALGLVYTTCIECVSLAAAPTALPGVAPTPAFNGHWRQGKAEISRFELEQERYGEIRQGEAMLVYVVEPFLPETQVKYEGHPAPDRHESVLKLNLTRKFHTGIYPYSMMTSVFSPLSDPGGHPYKITQSSQEWCGHTFTQVNNRGDHFDVRSFSYFQDEGDERFRMDSTITEDELWMRVRLDPASLHTGTVSIIPRLDHQRMRHTGFRAETATARVRRISDAGSSDAAVLEYELRYAELPRVLRLRFEEDFPHRIVGWEEELRKGDGDDAIVLTTRARLTNEMMSDYWNRNSHADSTLRKELGMKY
ncbi:MAG: septum formation inhibitor Maf [Bacteroidetes bacterium]|nr:septum formation inhibitor Maf [Bacteroidota bacterium]